MAFGEHFRVAKRHADKVAGTAINSCVQRDHVSENASSS